MIKKMIKKIKKIFTGIKNKFTSFTLAKCLSALISISVIAGIRYYFFGNIHLDSNEFCSNVGIGLLG
jgi:hypothetical protein